MAFREYNIRELKENFVHIIADEWMLISAGNDHYYNMMTASWGFFGELWGRDCAIAVIRPQRYTLGFVQSHEHFALSFYGSNKLVHAVCGTKSGRDMNKTSKAGLTPVFSDGTVYFKEARLVIICRKLYSEQFDPTRFTDESCLSHYKEKDYHHMFIAEIEKAYVNE